MAKIIILPESKSKKLNRKMYQYALSQNPDQMYRIDLNKGLERADVTEIESNEYDLGESWIINALRFICDKVSFTEDEVVFLSEEIYSNQLKVWFSQYSVPFSKSSNTQFFNPVLQGLSG
jgi:hypothetical protein